MVQNKKIIIGLVGLLAVGKTTFVDFCRNKYNAVSFRFSDSLRGGLALFGLPISRENLQTISTVMRQNFGENILAKAMAKRVSESDAELIMIDGVRRFTDLENLKNIPGFHLIAIKTDPKIAFKRYIDRNENVGDSKMNYKTFLEKQKAEADRQIPEVMETAEYTLENNDSFDDFYRKIDAIISQL